MVYDKEDGQIILSMNIMYNSLNINYKENLVFLFEFFCENEIHEKLNYLKIFSVKNYGPGVI